MQRSSAPPLGTGCDDDAGLVGLLRRDGGRAARSAAPCAGLARDRESAHADESPTIRLLCARGHEIRPVWLSEDHRGNFTVVPVHSERPHRGRARATAVDPLSTRANRTSRVCQQVGCPTLIDYEGTCVKHGAWKSDDTTSQTRFDCPRCPFTETVRPARLLKLYAVALRLGREDMPLR